MVKLMKKYVPWIFAFCIAMGWFLDRNASDIFAQKKDSKAEVSERKEAKKEKVWEAFEISKLIAKRKESRRWYLPFFKRETLSMGLYSLPQNADDKQPVHDEDEVYYIENGKATLRIGEEDKQVKKGTLVFVKGGIPHKFHSIEEPLDVLVFFSSAKPAN